MQETMNEKLTEALDHIKRATLLTSGAMANMISESDHTIGTEAPSCLAATIEELSKAANGIEGAKNALSH